MSCQNNNDCVLPVVVNNWQLLDAATNYTSCIQSRPYLAVHIPSVPSDLIDYSSESYSTVQSDWSEHISTLFVPREFPGIRGRCQKVAYMLHASALQKIYEWNEHVNLQRNVGEMFESSLTTNSVYVIIFAKVLRSTTTNPGSRSSSTLIYMTMVWLHLNKYIFTTWK